MSDEAIRRAARDALASGDPIALERALRMEQRVRDASITRANCETLRHQQTVFHKTLKNRDGSALRARVNGKCKTWSTRPLDFRLPMKHGLRDCFYIGPGNCMDWLLGDPIDMQMGRQPSQP